MVLTAAHCENPDNVIVNPYDLDDVNDNYRRNVVANVPHPNWPQELVVDFDVMILKLDSPITDIVPVRLNFDDAYPSASGEGLLLLGYGSTTGERTSSLEGPRIMQQAPTGYVTFEECAVAADPETGFQFGVSPTQTSVQDHWFCTIKTQPILTATCYGDSGGPVVKSGSGPETDLLVGTISGGAGDYCGNPYLPLWNQRVSYHADWITTVGCDLSDSPPDYWQCANGGGGGQSSNGGSSSSGSGTGTGTGSGTGTDTGSQTWNNDNSGGGSTPDTGSQTWNNENSGGGSSPGVNDQAGGGGEGGGGSNTGIIAAVGIVIVVLVLGGVGFFFWKRRQQKTLPAKKVDQKGVANVIVHDDEMPPPPGKSPVPGTVPSTPSSSDTRKSHQSSSDSDNSNPKEDNSRGNGLLSLLPSISSGDQVADKDNKSGWGAAMTKEKALPIKESPQNVPRTNSQIQKQPTKKLSTEPKQTKSTNTDKTLPADPAVEPQESKGMAMVRNFGEQLNKSIMDAARNIGDQLNNISPESDTKDNTKQDDTGVEKSKDDTQQKESRSRSRSRSIGPGSRSQSNDARRSRSIDAGRRSRSRSSGRSEDRKRSNSAGRFAERLSDRRRGRVKGSSSDDAGEPSSQSG